MTSEAKSYEEGLTNLRLVLNDGVILAKLMLEHSVGVQVKKTIKVTKSKDEDKAILLVLAITMTALITIPIWSLILKV